MLHRLLELVSGGGVSSIADLASKLGVSDELLGRMVDHLVEGGYLYPLADGCASRCAGCSSQGICAVVGGAHVWSLTEKGWKAIQHGG
jgi:hypothetical protein